MVNADGSSIFCQGLNSGCSPLYMGDEFNVNSDKPPVRYGAGVLVKAADGRRACDGVRDQGGS